MKWTVRLEVRDAEGNSPADPRAFTVESKSVTMALEKAVQQARGVGLQILAVSSCNPLTDQRFARF